MDTATRIYEKVLRILTTFEIKLHYNLISKFLSNCLKSSLVLELLRGITDFLSKLRKYFHRRTPREEHRMANFTEDELEMQNMMAADMATNSRNNDADNLIKAMSEGLSVNDRFIVFYYY